MTPEIEKSLGLFFRDAGWTFWKYSDGFHCFNDDWKDTQVRVYGETIQTMVDNLMTRIMV